ncbi:MAG TPA: polysaccharide deacetylase family protein, partial [Solirubrobacteraceae bacterium]|nr:polysaccharide deacetylase family protein [Solirubrobacteraceae bacterium]
VGADAVPMLRSPAPSRLARAAGILAAVCSAAWVLGGVGWPAASGSAAAAGDAPARQAPLPVASTSLVQDGQQLVWTLVMQPPFSPAGLARGGRVLCLELDPGGRLTPRRLCVVGPAHGSTVPRLEYVPPAGAAAVIEASVSRGSTRELTAAFLPSAVGLDYAPVHWRVLSGLIGSSCLRARRHHVPCTRYFPLRSSLASLHVPQLVGCMPSGQRMVYQGPSDQRVVALTFDDGPAPDTAQFLDILEREHVVATFFEIGKWVGVYGDHGAIERRMLADGDMIGDHTWDHANVSAGDNAAAGEITTTATAIRTATGGFQPCLFRPPYGATSPKLVSLAHRLGFVVAQWNVDPRDWSLPGMNAIYQNVIANAYDGSIILQHDGGGDRSETLAALPLEIEALKREGYRFETVTDLLGLRLIYK